MTLNMTAGKGMELPIFQDNLKSSGSWTDALAQAQAAWDVARLPEVRAKQVEQLAWRADITDAQAFARLRAAAELITTWAKADDAPFTQARLLELYGTLVGSDVSPDLLRKDEPAPLNEIHDPLPAVLLPRMLDNAFGWFATEGFAEMHAVEKAAVVYLRLLDLHSFPTLNETTALLATSFYIERANLTPLFIWADDISAQRFQSVTETAFRMLTQPLVEFFAEMLTRTINATLPTLAGDGAQA